jgi:hypothetical protein
MTINPKQLKVRFAYQFSGQHLGRTFYRGWFPTLVKLCEDIDAVLGEDKRGFHWTQLKEKWGAARFYWNVEGYGPNLRLDLADAGTLTSVRRSDLEAGAGSAQLSLVKRIDNLVRQAEHATLSRCIVCGQPAALSEEQPWVLALCEQHAELRRTSGTSGREFMETALFRKEER